jgi:hypothetical protein
MATAVEAVLDARKTRLEMQAAVNARRNGSGVTNINSGVTDAAAGAGSGGTHSDSDYALSVPDNSGGTGSAAMADAETAILAANPLHLGR